MKRGLLIGGGAAGVIVVVLVVVLVVVAGNIDSIIRKGVESYGSEMTQAKVTLNTVDISSSGEGKLAGLKIGNPKGFKTDRAFSLGAVKVNLDVASVTGKTVVVKEIAIDKPQVVYELGGAGSNIDALKRNIDSYLGKAPGGGKTGGAPATRPAKKDEGGKKLLIEHIYIRGGTVSVSATPLGDRKLTVALPDIHLTDIGKGKDGASPGEAAEKVLSAVSAATAKAVASLNLEKILRDPEKFTGEATKALEKGVKGVTKEIGKGDVGKAVEQGTGEVGKTLKGLFGK